MKIPASAPAVCRRERGQCSTSWCAFALHKQKKCLIRGKEVQLALLRCEEAFLLFFCLFFLGLWLISVVVSQRSDWGGPLWIFGPEGCFGLTVAEVRVVADGGLSHADTGFLSLSRLCRATAVRTALSEWYKCLKNCACEDLVRIFKKKKGSVWENFEMRTLDVAAVTLGGSFLDSALCTVPRV